jgi:hypothetical protein
MREMDRLNEGYYTERDDEEYRENDECYQLRELYKYN